MLLWGSKLTIQKRRDCHWGYLRLSARAVGIDHTEIQRIQQRQIQQPQLRVPPEQGAEPDEEQPCGAQQQPECHRPRVRQGHPHDERASRSQNRDHRPRGLQSARSDPAGDHEDSGRVDISGLSRVIKAMEILASSAGSVMKSSLRAGYGYVK